MTTKSKALRLADYLIQFANEVDHTHLTDDLRDAAEELIRLQAIAEKAKQLVDHADYKLAGCLNENSERREIPSNAVSSVKTRHLAGLRDALKGKK